MDQSTNSPFWMWTCAGLLLQGCSTPVQVSPVPVGMRAVEGRFVAYREGAGWVRPELSSDRSIQVLASQVRSVRVTVSSVNTSFRVARQAIRTGLSVGRWNFECLALPAGRHVLRIDAYLDPAETRPCGSSESAPFEIVSGRVSAVTLPPLRLAAEATGTWTLNVQTDDDSRTSITRYETCVLLQDGRVVASDSVHPLQSLTGIPVGIQKVRVKATAQRRGKSFTHTITVSALVRAGQSVETVIRFFPRGLADINDDNEDDDDDGD